MSRAEGEGRVGTGVSFRLLIRKPPAPGRLEGAIPPCRCRQPRTHVLRWAAGICWECGTGAAAEWRSSTLWLERAQWFAERRMRSGEAQQMPGTGRGLGVCSPSWVSLQAVWTDFVLCDEMLLKEQGAGAGMPPRSALHQTGTGGACLFPRPGDASLPVQGITARELFRFLNF